MKYLIATLVSLSLFSGRASAESIPDAEQLAIAKEAYAFLYPLVTMDVTRKVAIHSDPAVAGIGAAPNAFNHIRTFPPAEMRQVVRPNFDTLYSSAWLDLTRGPVVVSVPEMGERFYLLPMLDMWTDVFAVPGTRTSGNGKADFVVVPQGWTGDVPTSMSRIDAPTPYVWVIGRTQTNGPADYEAVHKTQDQYTITLLSDWGKAKSTIEHKIDASVDVKTEPLVQVNSMPAEKFFEYGAELMKLHPPHATDWPIVQRMKRIGIEPGKFDASKVSAEVIKDVPQLVIAEIKARRQSMAQNVNGWRMMTDGGVWGTAYFRRATTALGGLGANLPEDAMYPSTTKDADGNDLVGERQYTIRFEKGQLPPAGAFWSVTLYDTDGFQVANPLNRFAIGDRDQLQFADDGSLTIRVQHASPGPAHESNWLPVPATGKFTLTIRIYAPKAEALDGTWKPPAVERVL